MLFRYYEGKAHVCEVQQGPGLILITNRALERAYVPIYRLRNVGNGDGDVINRVQNSLPGRLGTPAAHALLSSGYLLRRAREDKIPKIPVRDMLVPCFRDKGNIRRMHESH